MEIECSKFSLPNMRCSPHSNNGVVVEFFSRLMLTSSFLCILNQTRMGIESTMQKNGLSYRMLLGSVVVCPKMT